MRFAAAVAAVAALSACERKPEEPIPDPEVTGPAVADVAAADSFGEPGDAVASVAFWSHPSVAFESLLFAATDGAIKAFRVETGETAFEIPVAVDDVEVIYAGEGQSAQGYLIAAGDGAYQLYSIDQDGKGFKAVATANAGGAAEVFCAGGGAAVALYESAAGKMSARPVTIVANGAELGDARLVAEVSDIVGCNVDPLTDEVIAVSRDGAVRRIDPKTGVVFGLALPQNLTPSSSGIAVGRSETGDARGHVALLDAASGVISVFDAKDGHAQGALRVKATFDLNAVETASRIAVGSANYGGVYRDGALAVVTSGEGAPVRLVPWNGVMGALSLPVAAVIDPRKPEGESAEEGVISIDIIEP